MVSMKENDAIKNAEVPNKSNKINKFQFSSQKQILANPKTTLFFFKFIFSLKTANLTTTTTKKIMVSLQANY